MSTLETEFQIPTQIPDPAWQHPEVVTRCRDAWNHSFKTDPERNQPFGPALYAAQAAYRKFMPPLVGYDNIRDFIACVAQGVLLGAITESQSSRLLYAAQVAQGTLRSRQASKPSA